jgi:POT family proton-dependent oligopeptide transporter
MSLGFGSHPRGLSALFFTEMWERFSYYGMRALLVLYLVDHLDYLRADALQVYATYTALVYLTPILGGHIADRWLGQRRAVLTGAILMAMGHFAMAFESLLVVALGLLVAGNGFFKPNISTIVGALYAENDPRRDSGFTLFYMGINLGAFFSPLVCGTLGEKLGWHYGFAAAGVGMVIGLIVFALHQHRLGEAGLASGQRARGSQTLTVGDWVLSIVISLVCLGLIVGLVAAWPTIGPWWSARTPLEQLGIGLGAAALVVAASRGWEALKRRRGQEARAPRLSRVELDRILVIAIVGFFWIFFWMGFEQAGGTMNLFAFQLTDRVILGWEMPASYFQSANPLFIFLLAPLFSVLWIRLDRSRHALSPIAKQAIGMIILGLGFVVLAVAQGRADALGQVGPQWLLTVYFIHTIGELFLSPIGLSMVTKLAPAHLGSVLMGLWFVTIAVANYLAGTLEQILTGTGIPLYWFLVGSSVGAGLVLLALAPWLRRLMHGVR